MTQSALAFTASAALLLLLAAFLLRIGTEEIAGWRHSGYSVEVRP